MDQAGLFMDEQRRRDVRRSGLNGVSDVELGAGPRTLTLRLFKIPTAEIGPQNVRIEGSARIRDIAVTDVRYEPGAAEGPGCFIVSLDKRGDFSTYTLRLVQAEEGGPTEQPLPGFDPICSSIEFRFRDVEAGLDCCPQPTRNAPDRVEPDINYLAKDYASFRQLAMDRLSLVMPDWRETHLPDLGVAMVEVLAYAGDHLSYQQDAVATEAYLATARQRISVRRHARLVDYRIHEGCNARTWIHIQTDADFTVKNAHEMRFVTDWGGALSADASMVGEDALANVSPNRYSNFEPVSSAALRVFAAHSQISFHAWGSTQFELPEGATSASLRDEWEPQPGDPAPGSALRHEAYAEPSAPPAQPTPTPAPARERRLRHLAAGDLLLLKEVLSAVTGQQADADGAHRHVVRLTRVVADMDPVYEQPIVHIEWADADALPFALKVSDIGSAPQCNALGPTTKPKTDISVACGNIVLADHGMRVHDMRVDREVLEGPVPIAGMVQHCVAAGRASDATVSAGRYRPKLKQAPLTFRCAVGRHTPAAQLLLQDPRTAVPQIHLSAIPGQADGSGPLFSAGDLDDARELALALNHALHNQSSDDRRAHDLIGRLEPATIGLLRHLEPSGPTMDAARHALNVGLRRLLQHWQAQPDLLESHAEDLHYTAEIDNDGYAHLRFGDGDCGKLPDAGTQFFATYRIGSGAAGNVGAGTLKHLVLRTGVMSGVTIKVCNPLPALGGTASESLRDIKLLAPTAMRATLERAITADDYAQLAGANPKIQRAAATLRWNGSRYLVRVAVDPLGTEVASPNLLKQVGDDLYRYRRIGHDVEVVPAKYVPLDISMTVHVHPHYHAKGVKGAVLKVFSTGVLADGMRAVFHPDNLSFGASVELSRLIDRAQRVAGVESVSITRLERLNLGPNDEIENGVLPIGPLEIPQLDNDANFPERGRFTLQMRGGR